MCFDAGANQLVIPMNANNALAFIRIDRADAERDVANPAIAFVNGRWFDGTDFRTRTMYSVG